MDEQFQTDLDAWLDATAERYEVARTLKDTPTECTQVVYRRDEQGRATIGPFVRKSFREGQGLGGVYEQILRAQTAGNVLRHQPILYECEHKGDWREVVMEYVAGPTLREYVSQRGPGIRLAREVVPELCDAVIELHEQFDHPLIHRDIKPSNVIMGESRLVLIDLGIARTYDDEATRDTVRYGTPGYAPPEQFGYGQTSVRSDVYALGMTIAYCLTGENPSNKLREQGFADARIPMELRPTLVQATQFDPQMRFASVRELRTAFLDALDQTEMPREPDSERPTKAHDASRTWVRVSTVLGRIWNCLVLVTWVFVSAAFFYVPFNPKNESSNLPIGLLLLMAFCLLVVPTTLVAYLLLDKRRLRRRAPFSRYTWRQELPFCLAVALASFLLVVIAIGLYRLISGGGAA